MHFLDSFEGLLDEIQELDEAPPPPNTSRASSSSSTTISASNKRKATQVSAEDEEDYGSYNAFSTASSSSSTTPFSSSNKRQRVSYQQPAQSRYASAAHAPLPSPAAVPARRQLFQQQQQEIEEAGDEEEDLDLAFDEQAEFQPYNDVQEFGYNEENESYVEEEELQPAASTQNALHRYQQQHRQQAGSSSEQTLQRTATRAGQQSSLRRIAEISMAFRTIFPYESFNEIQSECLDMIYKSDVNSVISAPTGAGKTVIFELAIIRLLEQQVKGDIKSRKPGQHKCVYMAPIKALCQERFVDWTKKFGKLGVVCTELTGDTENMRIADVKNVDIILTTPEKWDSMTRKWRDNGMQQFMSEIALFMIDEVHLLNEQRGAVLEAVVSRMKTVKISSEMYGKPSSNLRFIALSATIPNIEDIGEWLNAPEEGIKVFGDSYRPCELTVKVVGIKSNAKNPFMFERNLNYKLMQLITENNDNRPTLVFCSTRKAASQSATHLLKDISSLSSNPFIISEDQRKRLYEASKTATDKTLQDCIVKGIGFHSAAMNLQDRKLVEKLLLLSDLMVVCTTTTLAQGVNLPAHLVILKGTMQYKTGVGYTEYGELNTLQMIGRAGRPQFDESGVAIIMTKPETVHLYENIVARKQMVESNLHKQIQEHLNAEICLNTISDVSIAIQWIKSTFLYVRICKNPTYYSLPSTIGREKLEEKLKDILLRNLNEFAEYGVIAMDEALGLQPTEIGKAMARYYIAFDTLKQFSRMDKSSTMEDILQMIASAREFEECTIRLGEKKHLNGFNKDKIKPARFPIKGRVKTCVDKVYLLIQAAMADVVIDDWTLKQQTAHIFNIAPRICKCLMEYAKEKNYYEAYKVAVILKKCFEQKMWENSELLVKQLDGIGPAFSKALHGIGITSFEQLLKTESRKIEAACGRNPPFGTQVKENALSIPMYNLTVTTTNKSTATAAANKSATGSKNGPVIEATISRKEFEKQVSKAKVKREFYRLAVGCAGELLFTQQIITSNISESHTVTVELDSSKIQQQKVEVCLINENYIGMDEYADVKVPMTATATSKKGTSNNTSKQPATPKKQTSNSSNSSATTASSSVDNTQKNEPKTPTRAKKDKVSTPSKKLDEHLNFIKTKTAPAPTSIPTPPRTPASSSYSVPKPDRFVDAPTETTPAIPPRPPTRRPPPPPLPSTRHPQQQASPQPTSSSSSSVAKPAAIKPPPVNIPAKKSPYPFAKASQTLAAKSSSSSTREQSEHLTSSFDDFQELEPAKERPQNNLDEMLKYFMPSGSRPKTAGSTPSASALPKSAPPSLPQQRPVPAKPQIPPARRPHVTQQPAAATQERSIRDLESFDDLLNEFA